MDRGPAPPLPTPDQRARASELRFRLSDAVPNPSPPGVLLSGGLDTSVVSEIARPRGLQGAVTVLTSEDAPDRPFAREVAGRLGLSHHEVLTDLPGLLEDLPFVVRTLATFDPMEVRNSLVVARGLREARRLALPEVLTGDGADELFAGYSFLWPLPPPELRARLDRMAAGMRFSSFPLGEALGVKVRAPFLHPKVVAFAATLSREDLVGSYAGTTTGKLLLRFAFPEVPEAWRRKDPIEVGSGSNRLPAFFQEQAAPETLAEARRRIRREDGVVIRDAEHLAYYRVFKEVFSEDPPLRRWGPDPCPHCGFELPDRASDFCLTCGAYPARRSPPPEGNGRSAPTR
jgi:asparagine synthase (glutamine-hydrolysing)